MLSVYPSEIQQHYQQAPPTTSPYSYYSSSFRPMPHREPDVPVLSFTSMMNSAAAAYHHQQQQQHQHQHQHQHHSHHAPKHSQDHHHHQSQQQQQQDAVVAQALEIARESPDGASDPTVSKILEDALSRIWSRVEDQPDSYVMSRDEFAVFNFFQHRFRGNKLAVKARKLYWDNTRA